MVDTIPEDTPNSNTSPRYVVYALVDPRTNEVRYVGMTKDVSKRYAQHLNSPHQNERKKAWTDDLKASGMVPALTILESDIDQSLISNREKYWIQHYLAQGVPLTNVTGTNLYSVQGRRLLPLSSEAPRPWWVKLGYPPFDEDKNGLPCAGQVIKYYRERSNTIHKQKDLAYQLDVTEQRVRDIENRDAGFSMERRKQLVSLFNIPSFLLGILTPEDIQGWANSPYRTIYEYIRATHPPLPI